MRKNYWSGIAAISAAVSVMVGAFGAHLLKNEISPQMLEIFKTGVRYQMFHVIGLFAVGQIDGKTANIAGFCLLAGSVVFSASLYVLALTDRRGSVRSLP